MTTALEVCEGSGSRPGLSLPPGKTRYPLYRRQGGPQGRSGQVRKISSPTGFGPRTVQPVSHSLHRLRYPAQGNSSADCNPPNCPLLYWSPINVKPAHPLGMLQFVPLLFISTLHPSPYLSVLFSLSFILFNFFLLRNLLLLVCLSLG